MLFHLIDTSRAYFSIYKKSIVVAFAGESKQEHTPSGKPRAAMCTGEAHAVEKTRKRAATIRRRMIAFEGQPRLNQSWAWVFIATRVSGMTANTNPIILTSQMASSGLVNCVMVHFLVGRYVSCA